MSNPPAISLCSFSSTWEAVYNTQTKGTAYVPLLLVLLEDVPAWRSLCAQRYYLYLHMTPHLGQAPSANGCCFPALCAAPSSAEHAIFL